MSRRLVALVVLLLAAAGLAVSAATASPKKHSAVRSSHLLVGINDEADTLYGNPTTAFATLKSLPCDVFLGSHGNFFDLAGKMKRLGEKVNPFIDPDGYKKFVSEMEGKFEEQVHRDTGAQVHSEPAPTPPVHL